MVPLVWGLRGSDGGIDAATARADYAEEQMERSKAKMNRLEAVQQVRSSYGQYQTSRVAVDSARLAYVGSGGSGSCERSIRHRPWRYHVHRADHRSAWYGLDLPL